MQIVRIFFYLNNELCYVQLTMGSEFFQLKFFNNSFGHLAFFLLAFLGLSLIAKKIVSLLKERSLRALVSVNPALHKGSEAALQSIPLSFFSYVAFVLALQLLSLPLVVLRSAIALAFLWGVVITIRCVTRFFDEAVRVMVGVEGLGILRGSIIVFLWIIGVLLVLSNAGVNINSLIAGLGVGGVALALAVQHILGDLISSFALALDKLFKIGDTIVIGKTVGMVERIGVKTTTLRGVHGEEVRVPNKDIAASSIRNFRSTSVSAVALLIAKE